MLNSLPLQRMAEFLAAWDDQVEPLLREGVEKETFKETEGGTVKTIKVDRAAQREIRLLSLDEPEEVAKSRTARPRQKGRSTVRRQGDKRGRDHQRGRSLGRKEEMSGLSMCPGAKSWATEILPM
jgi:hypothetical protein